MARLWLSALKKKRSRKLDSKRKQVSLVPRVEELEPRLVPAVALPTQHVWGGANSTVWSDNGNWQVGGSPAGDPSPVLIFPASGVTNFISTDDIVPTSGANLFVNTIKFGGSGFTLNSSSGSATIDIGANGISSTNTSGINDVALNLRFNSSQPLTFTAASGGSLAIDGVISNTNTVPNPVVIPGQGTVIFNGNNSYSVPTKVNGGILLVNGFQASSPVTVNTGATLEGTGTVGTLTDNGGTVNPGPVNGTGVLTAQSTTFSSGAVFSVELNGTTVGSTYDQLDVNGNITLSNASLNTVVGFNSNFGDTFTIIKNNFNSPIVGTFNGLPEGAVFTANGDSFQISYVGGQGNDVVLKNVTPPCTPDDHFLFALYRDILNRTPDDPGFKSWKAALASGAPRGQVANGFWISVEHRGVEVDQFYSTFLQRGADPAGRENWVNQLVAGRAEADIAIDFLTSPEFSNRHPSNGSFVQALYPEIFNRPGSSSDIAYWQQILDRGARSRAAVVNYFLSSTESYESAINDYYEVFLGRAPDSSGRNAYFQALGNGASGVSIIDIFLGSNEYYVRAQSIIC